mgnify:CR=1 FL=1
MYLEKIKIRNFRQFKNDEINFNSNLTVIAGSNNSGKTSILDFIERVFSEGYSSDFTIQDFSICTTKLIESLLARLYEAIQEGHEENNEEIEKIKEKLLKECYAIEMFIKIGYEKDDDIKNFVEYLMELDPDKKYFYFYFKYSGDIERFVEELILNKEKYNGKNLFEHYIKTFSGQYYFCDSDYKLKLSMNKREFQKLCNFKFIRANKKLTDENIDKKYSIVNSLLNLLQYEDAWKETLHDAENKIGNLFSANNTDSDLSETIKGQINESSLEGLQDLLRDLQKINGSHDEVLHLDITIDETVIKNLLNNIIRAQYKIDNLYFDENIQGLGYSNLIYLYLNIHEFKKGYEKDKLNLLIIEEPEVHMHPQMQRAFIERFDEFFNEKIQGIITTHSTEIIKIMNIEKIRVIRKQKNMFESKIYDLNEFLSKDEHDQSRFNELLFNINLSDLIFADRAILYEGDTERMYLQSLIDLPLRVYMTERKKLKEQKKELSKFGRLKELYIAYIQVGGAYTHKYQEILEFLNIKSVIFTDIDYKKDKTDIKEIKNSESSNASLNQFLKSKKINELYEVKEQKKNIINNLLLVQFQDECDGYSRTLEEAMILKLFPDENISFKQSREKWSKTFEKWGLVVSLPQKKEGESDEFTLRDIIDRSGFKKTDFMYSVIEENNQIELLPNYIKEGLEWLIE